jgi:hypothetical protein
MKQISRLRWATMLTFTAIVLYAWRSHPVIESMGGFTVVLMLTAALPFFCFSILRALGAEPPSSASSVAPQPPPPVAAKQRYRGIPLEPHSPTPESAPPQTQISQRRYRGVPYAQTPGTKTKMNGNLKTSSAKKYRGVPLDP